MNPGLQPDRAAVIHDFRRVRHGGDSGVEAPGFGTAVTDLQPGGSVPGSTLDPRDGEIRVLAVLMVVAGQLRADPPPHYSRGLGNSSVTSNLCVRDAGAEALNT